MYLISQISKITGLTKKALRYYDEQKILVPSYRDEENGYRLYTEDGEDISFILEEKIQYIENNIAREKALISSIRKELEPVIRENEKEKYSVQIEEIQACTVAGLRFKDAYNQVGKYVPELFKVVKGEANGNCFNLYYDEDYAEIADIEVCVPVKRMVSGEGVSSRKLPGIKAVCTVHNGNYENLRYYPILDYKKHKQF